MKIVHKLTMVSSLLLIAGCSSWRDRHAQNDNYRYSSANYGAYGNAGGSSTSGSTASSGSFESSSRSFQPETSSGTSSQTGTQSSGDTTPLVPGLQITAQNGTLTISGTVSSEQEKQNIETIAKSAAGVASVNNQLQVSNQSQLNQPGTTENKSAIGGTSDQSTTSQSSGNQSSQETSPASSPQSSNFAPQYSTADRSSAEQAALGQASQATTDTGTLQNQELSATSDRTDSNRVYGTNQGFPTFTATTDADRTLGQQVVQQLKTDPAMADALAKVKFTIENGKVTLRGKVKSEDQKKKIESAVQQVTGVSSVDDQIQVGASGAETGANPNNQ